MRPPPPLSRFVHYPITAGVGIAAIFVTALKLAGRSYDPLVMNVLAFEGEPWRVVSSALPHGNLLHLAFNLIWLWIFGTVVEGVWGPVRTAAIFVVFAVASSLAEYAVFIGGIGLSGVGYGLFGLMWVLARRDPRFVGVMDAKTTRLFVAWFLLCVVLTVTNVMNIGNVAHGVGGVTGVLLGHAIVEGRRAVGLASGAALAVLVAAGGLGASVFRPQVNLSSRGGADSAAIAFDLLDGVHDLEAIHHLRRAVEIDDDDDASWYNIGITFDKLGLDPDGALRAYRRAYELDASDLHRGALSRALIRRGIARAVLDDSTGAIAFYKEALAVDPSSMAGWWNLSLAHAALEQRIDALDAARKAYALDTAARFVLASALDDVGRAARDREDLPGAVEAFTEAASLDPQPHRYALLASLYETLGRLDDADAARKKYLELGGELKLDQVEGAEENDD